MTNRFGCTYQFCDFCGRRNDCKIFCEYHKAQPQLTEAKEIIREMLCLFPDFKAKSLGDLHILNTLAKAEAFINKE